MSDFKPTAALKVLFVQDNAINESLALTELAGVLREQGYDYSVLVEREEGDVLKSAAAYGPSVVIIPSSIIRPQWGVSMARRIKSVVPDALCMLTGTYPTFFHDVINEEGVDVILKGEADHAVPEFLRRLASGGDITSVSNMWVKYRGNIFKNPIGPLTDLSALPLPDREVYYKYRFIRDFPLKRFISGRGCPNACSYCFNPSFKKMTDGRGAFVRKKDVGRMLEEIRYIADRYPLRHIHFSDDLFTFDKNWTMEFCDRYAKEMSIPFTFNSMADKLDEDIIRSVRHAGCSGIAVGIESGNDDVRVHVLNRRISDDEIVEKCKRIKEHGMSLTTFNMIGNPGEGLDEVFQTIELNRKIRPDNPRITVSVPIEGTKLYDFAVGHGYLERGYKTDFKSFFNSCKPIYRTPYAVQFENLFYTFPFIVRHDGLYGVVSRLAGSPRLTPVFKLAAFGKLFYEKRFFNAGLLPSIIFYLHTGGPANWSSIYSMVI
ncbi:MAG: B12-binding domain-containing radical SAM protein [Deltaproteobacteria bacterium]|nr:B12-binding domain-containing radical SAM protein [Deltaproteobacteria bacterium]